MGFILLSSIPLHETPSKYLPSFFEVTPIVCCVSSHYTAPIAPFISCRKSQKPLITPLKVGPCWRTSFWIEPKTLLCEFDTQSLLHYIVAYNGYSITQFGLNRLLFMECSFLIHSQKKHQLAFWMSPCESYLKSEVPIRVGFSRGTFWVHFEAHWVMGILTLCWWKFPSNAEMSVAGRIWKLTFWLILRKNGIDLHFFCVCVCLDWEMKWSTET